jgi:5-(aminomethyl)-3-furanmethanol phosphate kinase
MKPVPLEGALVIKVGGGLSSLPGALERISLAVARAAAAQPVLVVPGGGPFADAVRAFDRNVGLDPHAAHWMAVLAMDQYAHVLASRIPGALLVEEVGEIAKGFAQRRPVVLAPSRWMRAADLLPHSWDVTSDSIAAVIAGGLGASRLVLVKPTCDPRDALDPYFSTALPAGLAYTVIGCDQLERLTTG